MKPKNVMLLGFINKAAKYLDRELGDTTNEKLNRLKDFDLKALKEELGEDLNASLGTMQSTINTLLLAGEEAFDDFFDSHLETQTLSEELDRIFDQGSEKKSNESDLDKLLEFYNLNDLELDEEDFEEELAYDNTKEESKDEEFSEFDTKEEVFEMSDEDNELLKQIAQNVNKAETKPEVKPEEKEVDVKKLDSIFTEVVNHEDEPKQAEETVLPEQVDKNNIIELVKDIQASKETYFANVPDPVYDNEPNEEEIEEINKQLNKNEEVYVSSLIEDLRERMVHEDEQKKVKEEEFREIYDRIHKIYPYLSNAFIRTVYDLKESLARDYPLDENVIVLHRCIFKEVESLRQFVEIALSHNFSINADEGKLMVDVIKEYMNTDGKIITSIFEVANQSALLGGEYDGYRVMLEEKA